MLKRDYKMNLQKPVGPNDSYIIRFISKKIFHDHEDFILITTGKRGKGKSYADLRLGETFAAVHRIPFSVRDNVKHTVKSFLKTVNSGVLEEGSPIIIEEAGVGVNSRNFMSDVNKALNFVCQTVRTRHYFIMVNLPLAKMTDLSVRNLATARLEMIMKIPGRKVSIGKFKLLDFNENVKTSKSREVTRFLRFKIAGDSRMYKVSSVEFQLPSEQVILDYEAKKKEYTKQLYEDLEQSIVEAEFGEIENDADVGLMPVTIDKKEDRVNMVLLKNLLSLKNDYGLGKMNISKVTKLKPKVINALFKYAKEHGFDVRTATISRDEFETYGGIAGYRKKYEIMLKQSAAEYEKEKNEVKS